MIKRLSSHFIRRVIRNKQGIFGLAALGFGGKKLLDSMDGGDSAKMPDFQVDPYYTKSQETLGKLGEDILSGNLPDYYKPIGDFNSPQFQAMLDSVIGKIQGGVMESAAQSGTARSGVMQTASADALGQVVPQLGYADYLRAMQGREGLLTTGIGVEQNVGAAGQRQEQLVNSYNEDQTKYNNEQSRQSSMDLGKLFGTLGGAAIGSFAGPQGALTGAGIGGGLFGGNSSDSSTSSLSKFLDSIHSIGGTNTPGTTGYGNGIVDNNFGSFGNSVNNVKPLTMADLYGGQ